MPRLRVAVCALVVALAASAVRAVGSEAPPVRPAAPAVPRTFDEKRIGLPIVGAASVYVPRTPTPRVILIVSDEAGWNKDMAARARQLATQAVVVGLSYPALTRHARREGGCWYVASDLELISHAAQKTLNLTQYHAPTLVGVGRGGAVVYSAVAAGPDSTFAGLITIDFCPTLRAPIDVCAGDTWSPVFDGKQTKLPAVKRLPKDWWVLQPERKPACSAEEIRRLTASLPNAHVADPGSLDKALQELWAEKEVKPAAAQPRSATTRELEDELQRLQLPLELRWPGPGQLTSLLVFFSGDGGWASLDEETAERLVGRGVGVIGVSSLRYFWKVKPPAQVAEDIRRLVSVAARAGHPVFAGGFSFGAEVVPVSLHELPVQERRAIAGVVMIAPGPSASFEIDPLDWLRNPVENPATRVVPAVQSLGLPALCLAGATEEETPCPALATTPGVRVVRLPGSHHFDNNYTAVADTVLQFIRTTQERRP